MNIYVRFSGESFDIFAMQESFVIRDKISVLLIKEYK